VTENPQVDPSHVTSQTALLKRELRKRLRSEARLRTIAQMLAASRLAAKVLESRPEWVAARTIMGYAALPDELDLWPVLHAAIQAGKTVALPRFNPLSGTYLAALVEDTSQDLVVGHLGIPEPAPDCALVPLNRLDFTLVPGLGFDLDGHRLGRGRGFYDRLLPQAGGLRCGVAMDGQILPSIPAESHDQTLDCILTPTRWWVPPRRAG